MAAATVVAMNLRAEQLKSRSFEFALTTARFCRTLPTDWEGRHIAEQLFRSSTSVAANYRAVCRARSLRDFIAKLGIVVEEADESLFWLVFAKELGLVTGKSLEGLLVEGNELLAIFTASAKTASSNYANRR